MTMTVICALVGHGLMAILNFEQLSKKSELQCATLCISDNWKNVYLMLDKKNVGQGWMTHSPTIIDKIMV